MIGSDSESGLDFIDLLYAVPVVTLADRVNSAGLDRIRWVGWADIAVALAAITFGWLGHHTNRQRVPTEAKEASQLSPFTTPRFWQLVVEILVVVVYFVIVMDIALPRQLGVNVPTTLAKARWLTVLFVIYIAWDILDVQIAKKYPWYALWKDRAKRGSFVTLAFVGVFAMFFAVAAVDRVDRSRLVIVFDLAALVCLYAYRVIQQELGKRSG
jgi:hypothetical protein